MRQLIEEKIANDFDRFEFTDASMEQYCSYHRSKHIAMATQIVMNYINNTDYAYLDDINDLIHGLNHIFFNGVAAGQTFEWFKKEG